MQAEAISSLPRSKESDPSFRVWKETEGGLDAKLTAVFIYALKTFARDYLPKSNPSFPVGFEMDHNTYLQVNESPQKKSEAFKALYEKYKGYFDRLWEVQAENSSNLNFLKEAKEHFEKVGLTGHALKVQQLIGRFV